jgi:hypothetical protein
VYANAGLHRYRRERISVNADRQTAAS